MVQGRESMKCEEEFHTYSAELLPGQRMSCELEQ